ncbi:MAG: M56 family metallopeptidase [Oscillibacter sp.]|nr:M56 family metallopeptidase [Oscillibacter sp.]MDY5711474.1 M56 family metallopeptidase [Oscillospiraceae bacterium]MDY5942565.1 M56 family metallopeptidase [Oscillospiraceae bacterium]
MEQFLLNLLKTSLLGALVIAALLAAKPLWKERYRAGTRCWLWLALAVFLLLPIDFSVKDAPVQVEKPKDYTVFVGTDKTAVVQTDHLFGDMAAQSGQTSTQVRDAINARPVTNPELKTTRYIPVTSILFWCWAAGAAAFVIWQGAALAAFRRTVRRWRRAAAREDYLALLDETARELNVRAPEMIVCEAVTTPAVTGVFRPTLLLPHEQYDTHALRFILRHELCHLKRRDMLFKLVLLAANAMHWFNPMAYLLLRQADEDIELACDSAATQRMERLERADYSRTLLAAVQAKSRTIPATTCFGGTVERLRQRITNVLGAQKKRGLGVAALVLALTLTAGCATGWGSRDASAAPFDGSRYNPVFVFGNSELTTGKDFRPLYYVSDGNGFSVQLSQGNGVKSVALTYGSTVAVYMPMESVTLTQENFDGTLLPDLDALRGDNKAAWRVQLPDDFDDHDPEASPNLVFLLEQEDGTLYLCIGYHFEGGDAFIEDTDRIRWVYRLEKEDDTLYASMDDYAAACVEDLKQDTMTYYVRVNGMGVVEDTVADVRVTQLELGDSLEGLSPDGTALELWYFNYEMKPTNEAGVEIDPVGGQYVTDDGFLRESWTHYLTVLHHTGGEQTGYQIIGTYTGNDGLWYNGCGYSGEEKYYLHDFYVDYAGLDLPKMLIPNLLNAATDGYGRANQCEAQLISGDGSYYFYAPITDWACNPGTEFWYSRYDTGSYFNAKKLEQSLDEAKAEWESSGAKAEKTDAGWRFVTNEGMSNTIVTLFDAPDGTCYEVTTHWTFDGSTKENQWGWNRDRAVEGEAEVLRAMVRSFTVNWDADAADPAAERTAAKVLGDALQKLGDMSSEVTLSLSVNGKDSSIYDGSSVTNRAYFARQLSEILSWREAGGSAAPSAQNCILLMTADGGVLTVCESQPMHLWLTTPDGAAYCFKTDSYDDLSIVDGDGRTLYSLMRLWYDEAEYDALLGEIAPQPKSLSWQEAAQQWADAYFGTHTRATSGSSFKYTWVKALITPAEDTTKAMREQGEIDGSTYCFSVEVQFTPESETALQYAMAGNTGECTDPSAPKGAYAFWRCCTIQQKNDGRWYGLMLGTGW